MIEAKIINSRGQDMVCLIEYKNEKDRGKKTIIYKHGFCGNKITPHRMMVNLGHDLVEEGYTVVRFDCAGAGDSEGDWTYMTISGETEDFKKILHWVKDVLTPEKTMILGYSMGALETALCCREILLDEYYFGVLSAEHTNVLCICSEKNDLPTVWRETMWILWVIESEENFFEI